MFSDIADGLGFTRGKPRRPFTIGYHWFNLVSIAVEIALTTFV